MANLQDKLRSLQAEQVKKADRGWAKKGRAWRGVASSKGAYVMKRPCCILAAARSPL